MAVSITPIGKKSPTNPELPMLYYPKVTKTGEIELDELAAVAAYNTTVTQTDCYAVIISLVDVICQSLEEGKIVRVGHLGSFQISVKGTPSTLPIEVSPKNVKSSSVIFRPGKKFKTMLGKLKFIRK